MAGVRRKSSRFQRTASAVRGQKDIYFMETSQRDRGEILTLDGLPDNRFEIATAINALVDLYRAQRLGDNVTAALWEFHSRPVLPVSPGRQ